MFYNKKACDNGKASSPIHGHLKSNAALLLPSLLLAQCKLFMASTSKPETPGKKIKMQKEEVGVCTNCTLKRKSVAESS